MTEPVACAVLAAGASRRLGRPKQLLVHCGRPLVLLAAQCARQSQATACAVVIGAHGKAVRAALGDLPIEVLDNPSWAQGVASSIRVATAWAKQRRCRALLIALCDQPQLTAAHLDRLITEHERCRLIVASYYAGKNAVPALFPEAYFEQLSGLCGDAGATRLVNGGLPVGSMPWPDGAFDVDTPEAARHLQANHG